MSEQRIEHGTRGMTGEISPDALNARMLRLEEIEREIESNGRAAQQDGSEEEDDEERMRVDVDEPEDEKGGSIRKAREEERV